MWQALAIAREIKATSNEEKILGNIGNVYEDLGQYHKALDYDQQELAIAREIKDRQGEEQDLGNIGLVYKGLGQYDQALDCYEQALIIAREIKDISSEGSDLSSLAVLWDKQGRPRIAAYYGKQAVNISQSIRQNVRNLDISAQKSYLETVQGRYRTLADILVELGLFGEAEQVLGMLKEQEQLDFVRRDAKAVPAATDTLKYDATQQRLADRDRQLSDSVTGISVQIDDLLRKVASERTPEENNRLVALQDALIPAQKAWNVFAATLPGELAELPSGPKPAASDMEGTIQTTLHNLPAGTVLVYAIVLPKYLRLVVVTPQISKAEEYKITDKDLRKLVFDWLGELTSTDSATGRPNGNPDVLGRKLYNVLVGPIAKDLAGAKATTVMWWLDDVLHYVPVAALTDGHQYMVERYRNTVFTNDTRSVLSNIAKEHGRMLGLGVSEAHGDYPQLKGVPGEMYRIVQDKEHPDGIMPGDLLMDDKFTARRMYDYLNQGYPMVHIASHFRLGTNYDTSELLLGDGKTLTLQDLSDRGQVFQSVDLLVFSACQTAMSTGTGDGHELESLAGVAQQKGASSVLASLWPVADESTPVLMEEFYGQMSRQKSRDMALALQEAQLALLHGDGKSPAKYGHPYYWAPFILMGNWR